MYLDLYEIKIFTFAEARLQLSGTSQVGSVGGDLPVMVMMMMRRFFLMVMMMMMRFFDGDDDDGEVFL